MDKLHQFYQTLAGLAKKDKKKNDKHNKNCEFYEEYFFIPLRLFAVMLEMHEWWVTNNQHQCDDKTLFGANNQ